MCAVFWRAGRSWASWEEGTRVLSGDLAGHHLFLPSINIKHSFVLFLATFLFLSCVTAYAAMRARSCQVCLWAHRSISVLLYCSPVIGIHYSKGTARDQSWPGETDDYTELNLLKTLRKAAQEVGLQNLRGAVLREQASEKSCVRGVRRWRHGDQRRQRRDRRSMRFDPIERDAAALFDKPGNGSSGQLGSFHWYPVKWAGI